MICAPGIQLRRSFGVSMIEILVGVLLISFGILGLISLLGRSVQLSVSSEDSSRAALLANDIAAAIISANVGIPRSAAIVVNPAVVAAWQAEVANPVGRGLPNGAGTVTVAARNATIQVEWRAPGAASSATTVNRYATTVVIP